MEIGRLPITITHLEMLSPEEIRPRRCEDARFSIRECTVKQWRFNRFLYLAVGEAWAWHDKRGWADEQWRAYAESDRLRTFAAFYDGSPAEGNPFAGKPGALPEIWTLGHRNVQAAAFDPKGRLWEVEHGTRGGDELNLIEKGGNYGWPIVAYGVEYSGAPIAFALTNRPGFEQPVYYWDPVIAPSGAQFYTGNAFPEWRGNLFVGALKEQRLVRLVLENDRVIGEEHLLVDRRQRIRDVRQGPDGALYLVTDERRGELWKLAPRR